MEIKIQIKINVKYKMIERMLTTGYNRFLFDNDNRVLIHIYEKEDCMEDIIIYNTL